MASVDLTPDPRRWWTLAASSVALLVLAVDNTILNVALPTIERDLGATSSELQWIVDSYLLVFAGLLLTMGTLGDRFGRRRALATGLVLFGAASALSAAAATPEMLIAARALMGAGGALVMPATLSIVTNAFPPGERAKAIGIWAGVFGLGVAIGPTAGGVLLEHFSWGAVFLVNVPVVLAALAAARVLVPESRDPAAPPVDLVGAGLSIVGLAALVFGVIEAPEAGWTAARTIAVLVLALITLAAFAAWERRAAHPMLDVRVLGDPRFGAASGALALAAFSLFGAIFFLTQHLQGVLGLDPLEAGVRLLPVAGGLMIAAPLSSRVSARLGTRLTVALGMVGVAGGLSIMLEADQAAGYAPVAASMVVMAIGMGTAMAPATASVMGALPLAKAGVGSALNDTARMVGGALGVAVLGSVLASGYRGRMQDAPQAAQESLAAALAMAAGRGDEQLARAAADAFVAGMHASVLVAVAAALGAAALAFALLPSRRGARRAIAAPEAVDA